MRKTFREKASKKAYQRQIREDIAADPARAGVAPRPTGEPHLKAAIVRPTSRKVAQKIILHYEWLGTLPICRSYYGIFFDKHFCGGVVCFGSPAGNRIAEQVGVDQREMAYLARGACTHWTPKGTGSKLISYALKLEKKRGRKIAIAYSDTDAGEIGTLYQATNWICIGQGGRTTQLIHPNGKIYDQKIIHDTKIHKCPNLTWGQLRQKFLAAGWKENRTNPKWRYVYILATGKERERILSYVRPLTVEYPKRKIDRKASE